MVLDGLVAEIERVKATIANHRELLTGSEALTRYALIDPLLRALEWDTADPGVVQPERRGLSGIADYALMGEVEPAALLEAKRLGGDLADGIDQAVKYCNTEGIAYMAVSDGSRWELYEVFRRARLEDRRITSFNIERDPNHAVALKALHLWRPNLSAQSITPPPERIVRRAVQETGEAAAPIQEPQTPLTPSSGEGWRSLPVAAEMAARSPHDLRLPYTLRFPDSTESRIGRWYDVLTHATEWLLENGSLMSALPVPISRSNPSRYLVSLSREHGDGEPFFQPRQVRSVFVVAHGSRETLFKQAIHLFHHCGVDPATVHLRFGG